MMTETNFMFENRPNDIPSTELEVEGTVPAALRGRFLANGPGRIKLLKTPTRRCSIRPSKRALVISYDRERIPRHRASAH
jgi:hypothetical protein